MKPNRTLTHGECHLLETVFGTAIDVSCIKIFNGRFMPFQHTHTAMSPNGAMYLCAHYCDDFSDQNIAWRALFVHEAVHVWQKQMGFPVIWAGICLALQGGYWKNRAYRYEHLLHQRHHFSQFNMEQQAMMIEDYCRQVWQNQTPPSLLTQVIEPFLDNPHDKNLLPRSLKM